MCSGPFQRHWVSQDFPQVPGSSFLKLRPFKEVGMAMTYPVARSTIIKQQSTTTPLVTVHSGRWTTSIANEAKGCSEMGKNCWVSGCLPTLGLHV